mmetsp:Transcript_10217/g.21634  ORF Transcript_10217/g.21634 Transcript_10217/m.21634 type:complete len:248 (+) Transcript_10217:133-876(+)
MPSSERKHKTWAQKRQCTNALAQVTTKEFDSKNIPLEKNEMSSARWVNEQMQQLSVMHVQDGLPLLVQDACDSQPLSSPLTSQSCSTWMTQSTSISTLVSSRMVASTWQRMHMGLTEDAAIALGVTVACPSPKQQAWQRIRQPVFSDELCASGPPVPLAPGELQPVVKRGRSPNGSHYDFFRRYNPLQSPIKRHAMERRAQMGRQHAMAISSYVTDGLLGASAAEPPQVPAKLPPLLGIMPEEGSNF